MRSSRTSNPGQNAFRATCSSSASGDLNEDWAVDARVFYALEAIGEVERVHRPLFTPFTSRAE